MEEFQTQALIDAIRDLHGCDSTHLESVAVMEAFEDGVLWQGTVEVFELHEHPEADRCYAWADDAGDSEKRRFVAVLHVPPVDSPAAAVRAVFVAQHPPTSIRYFPI